MSWLSFLRNSRFQAAFVLGFAVVVFVPQDADACGGFFCSAVPVNQVGEQIIFHQDGDTVTAIVLIQYQGAAEDFSWVIPVPGIPEVTLSSDMLFSSLDPLTQPRFALNFDGEGCEQFRVPGGPGFGGLFGSGLNAQPAMDGGGGETVQVIERYAVGPFDVEVVTSTDADVMAKWLIDNDYDLTDRGRDLIAPYVELGMNFVALKLQKDQDTGDIRPLKMVYNSERPMIPIRLTAVAAEPDMGVLVWLLGPARAVPLNYPHVIVNYAKLDWFGGQFGAYQSYVDLITEAMDEAGGIGFATDYSAKNPELLEQLPNPEDLMNLVNQWRSLDDPLDAIIEIGFDNTFPLATVRALFNSELPLPDGEPQFTYGNRTRLRQIFTAEQRENGLNAILDALETTVIQPYASSLPIFDNNPHITRLFTTLSAEEMTIDPVFGYNPDLSDQAMVRNATVNTQCVLGVSQWQLTLGEGTGRDGEVIMTGSGDYPNGVPDVFVFQSAIKETQMLRESGDAETMTNNSFGTVRVSNASIPILTACGIFQLPLFTFTFVGLLCMRRRR